LVLLDTGAEILAKLDKLALVNEHLAEEEV